MLISSIEYKNLSNFFQVFASITTDSEEVEFNLLKCPAENLPKDGPPPITPPGLPLQRQWYLFNQIREYVKDSLHDVVCPRPVEPAPIARTVDSDLENIPIEQEVDPSATNTGQRKRKKTSSHKPCPTLDSDTDEYDPNPPIENKSKRGRGRGSGASNRGRRSKSTAG